MKPPRIPKRYAADYPEAYMGQTRHDVSDEFSTFRDVSNPQDAGRDRGPMDAVDPEKPVGAQQAAKPSGNKRRIIRRVRWKRAR